MRMISRVVRPSARRRATYLRVRSSLLMRVNTIRQRAWLACRFPPGLSRWRLVLPDDAGRGATPQRCANAASLRSRCGLSPAATSRIAAPCAELARCGEAQMADLVPVFDAGAAGGAPRDEQRPDRFDITIA